MPSVSESQRRLFGIALSVKRGKTKINDVPSDIRKAVQRIVKTMSEKKIKEFAKKPTKALVIALLDAEEVKYEISSGGGEEKKIVKFKKQILKKGSFAHPQDPDKQVVYNVAFFKQVKKAFDEGAVDNVPVIIDSHDETIDDTVGRVLELVIEKDGLYAILEIADEDVVEKIETKLSDGKGVIDEVSVSLGATFQDDGTFIPIALFHVAIVPHAFYRGMKSFEKLAASLDSDLDIIFLINGGDLQQKIFRVRQAFYKQKGFEFGGLYVEEVWDDFVVAVNDATGKLFKFDYTIDSEGISFGEDTEVEKSFKEVKSSMKDVTVEQVLAFLKDNEIEVDSLDDLKGKIAVEVKPEVKAALEKQGVVQKDESPTLGEALTAAIVTVTAQGKQIETLTNTVATLQSAGVDKDAGIAVDALLKKGKILASQTDDYTSLYKNNPTLFASMTEKLPVIVDMEELGRLDNEHPGILSSADALTETERILSKSAGKSKGGN